MRLVSFAAILVAAIAQSTPPANVSGDANWYNKWYSSDTVYIDGDGNTQKTAAAVSADEGSGRGGQFSDLESELGSGMVRQPSRRPTVVTNPPRRPFDEDDEDDEDTIPNREGSGSSESVSTTTMTTTTTTRKPWSPSIDEDDEDMIVQGSGDGMDMETTRQWAVPVETTQTPYKPPSTTTESWWQPEEATSTRLSVLVEERTTTTTARTTTTTTTTKAPAEPEKDVVSTASPDDSIYEVPKASPFDPFLKPGILAAVIGGAVVGLLAAILLVMFIVYRMRKKDEGSYALEEPKSAPTSYSYAYQKAPAKEFYA